MVPIKGIHKSWQHSWEEKFGQISHGKANMWKNTMKCFIKVTLYSPFYFPSVILRFHEVYWTKYAYELNNSLVWKSMNFSHTFKFESIKCVGGYMNFWSTKRCSLLDSAMFGAVCNALKISIYFYIRCGKTNFLKKNFFFQFLMSLPQETNNRYELISSEI